MLIKYEIIAVYSLLLHSFLYSTLQDATDILRLSIYFSTFGYYRYLIWFKIVSLQPVKPTIISFLFPNLNPQSMFANFCIKK